MIFAIHTLSHNTSKMILICWFVIITSAHSLIITFIIISVETDTIILICFRKLIHFTFWDYLMNRVKKKLLFKKNSKDFSLTNKSLFLKEHYNHVCTK